MKMLHALLIATALGPGFAVPAHADEKPTEQQVQTRAFYLQLIHQARADGRPRAAIAYLDDFDRQFPHDPDARLLRVNSLLDLGQVDEADAVLATLAHAPATAGLNAARGHALAARGAWAKAVPCYEAAVAISPAEPFLKNALGYALLRSHQIDRAVEQLRGAADLAPGNDVIRNNLILAFMLDGRKEQADEAIARVRDAKAQASLKRSIGDEVVRLGKAEASLIPAVKKVA